MKLITVYLPEGYLKALDQLVLACFYPNRSEAIRSAIRELIQVDAGIRESIEQLKGRNLAL